MEERAHIPVTLPVPFPTTSYWQTPPDPTVADIRTTSELPKSADCVIIGSGISGACIAFNILEKLPVARVVMLEARQACSGASGRNGGHLKPASYRSFPHNAATYGVAEATRIAALEHTNRDATIAFARKHNISCDLHPCRTADIVLDPAQLATGKAAIAQMAASCPADADVETYAVYDAHDAQQRFLTPSALGAFEYDAGSIQPYRFVTGVLKLALARGLNLQTHTPATRIEQGGNDDAPTPNGTTAIPNGTSTSPSAKPTWHIHTPRGTIRTQTLILATNGYTAALLPQPFQTHIIPLRGQMSVQTPGPGLPHGGSLRTTFSFLYAGGYEYMITRPGGTADAGAVCIGGGLGRLPDAGKAEFGVCDDSALNADVGEYLARAARGYFGENWGDDGAVDGRAEVKAEWTGIMGVSADGLPFVGEVPGRKGLWVSVCFNGHGMCIAFLAARGLVQMLFGEEEKVEGWFPRSYRVTRLRDEVSWRGTK